MQSSLTSPAAAEGPPKQLGLRVVVVDDNAVYREFLAYLLAQAGAIVVGEAADGEEAFHVVQNLKPDLVLIDVQMPRVNGFQATQRIKKEIPVARVIILSGAADAEFMEAAHRSGADAFLPKSTMPTALVSAIQQVVSRGSSKQQSEETGAAR